MKTHSFDIDPGDRDPGDRDASEYEGDEAPAPVADVAHPSHRPAAGALAFAGPTSIGRDALDDAQELLRQSRDDEAMRASVWNRLTPQVRKLAVWAAGMEQARGVDALSKFDALERGLANVALERMIRQLEHARRCMAGGEMPSTRPSFDRSNPGIAALEAHTGTRH